jgi:isopenicillin-N N-acyltransferase like protein
VARPPPDLTAQRTRADRGALTTATDPEEMTVRPDDAQHLSDSEPWETGRGTFAELRGSPYQQGLTQGRIAAANIAANVRITRQVAAELGGGADYQALTRANERFVREASPATLEEVAGLADGAGLPYPDLLALNLPAVQTAHFVPRECTQFVVRPPVTRDGHTYLAKNRDKSRPYRQIVLRRWLDRQRWVVQANVAGSITWPGIGINSDGLALATSGVWSRRTRIDWDSAGQAWLMLNTDLLLRGCATIEDLSAAISAQPRLTPELCLAADGHGAVVYEITTGEVYAKQVAGPVAVRSNHAHHSSLAGDGPTEAEYPSTYHRWRRADAELRRRAGQWDTVSLAGLLADHDGYPERSLCRHPTGGGGHRTAYSVVIDLDTRGAVALLGNPCTRLRPGPSGATCLRDGPGVIVLPAPGPATRPEEEG